MIRANWWEITLGTDLCASAPALKERVSADVVVIGGGMAGLHAAYLLAEAGRSVVLLEKDRCGGGTTGKSAGFLTPYSDLELYQLVRGYGEVSARLMWEGANEGISHIVSLAEQFRFSCDMQKQDSIYLAKKSGGMSSVRAEADAHRRFDLPHYFFNKAELREVLESSAYRAGVAYGGTYSFNPFRYAQSFKCLLAERGVTIYENTEALTIDGNIVKTRNGSVTADQIVVCLDKMRPEFSPVARYIHAAQTVVAVSEPLSPDQVKSIFPRGPFMCWDSALAFTYFRLTPDNRLVIGGSSALNTFAKKDTGTKRVIERVIRQFQKDFPQAKNVIFSYFWSGRIDTTKDFLPIIDRDPANPAVLYVIGCVGLGWAAFCGLHAARRVLGAPAGEYERYFNIEREYFIPRFLEWIIGRKAAFMLSALYHKFFQGSI